MELILFLCSCENCGLADAKNTHQNVNLLVPIGQFGVGTYFDFAHINYSALELTLGIDDAEYVYKFSLVFDKKMKNGK